jgi:hypothetical protein
MTMEQPDPGGGELNDPVPLADLGVVVDVEPELLGVERLRTVHVRDGDPHHFERPIHEASPVVVAGALSVVVDPFD